MSRKILTSLPLINTANLELHVEQFPLKRSENQLKGSSTAKVKRVTSRPAGETETQSHQKPHSRPGKAYPQLGDISQIESFSLRNERFVFHITHPTSWDLNQRHKPSTCLASKTNRAYPFKNQRGIGNGDPALQGLTHILTCPKTQCKSSSFKSPQTICEGD